MLSGRRGISPLIATVLLIAFAVALGAVVMNFGRTLVGGELPTGAAYGECAGVKVAIKDINGPQIKLEGSGSNSRIVAQMVCCVLKMNCLGQEDVWVIQMEMAS